MDADNSTPERESNGDFAKGNQLSKGHGRPTKFTPETTNEICQRLIAGETLTSICNNTIGMPSINTIYRWLYHEDEKYDGFRSQYARARKLQAKTWAEMSVDIVMEAKDERQSHAFITARKNISDTLKWHISKLDPMYADKTQVQHSGAIAVDVHVDRPPAIDRGQWIAAHTHKLEENKSECIDITPTEGGRELSTCNHGEKEE